jgi:hypothetical protein
MADDEKDLLLAWLGAKRRHVLSTLDGVADEDVRRGVLPSGWSAIGAVQHLTFDVERWWFRAVLAGERVDLIEDNQAWVVAEDVAVSDVVALYRDECERADAIIRATALAAAPAWWPGGVEGCPYADLREILLHVIVETATHAGHLDAVRELVDGHQHLVMG